MNARQPITVVKTIKSGRCRKCSRFIPSDWRAAKTPNGYACIYHHHCTESIDKGSAARPQMPIAANIEPFSVIPTVIGIEDLEDIK